MEKGLTLKDMSIILVAATLLEMHQMFPTESRYVYAALLKLPGMQHLKFETLLQPLRKIWQSTPKYSTFWDPEPVLQKVAVKFASENSVRTLRDKLILSFRLF